MSSKLVFLSITCLAVSYVVRSKKKSNGLHTSFAVCPKSYSVMIFVTKCLSSPSSSYLPSRSFLPPSTLQLFPSCPHSLLILLPSLLSFLFFIHLSFPPLLFLIAALQSFLPYFFFPIHPYIHSFILPLLHPSLPPTPPFLPPFQKFRPSKIWYYTV